MSKHTPWEPDPSKMGNWRAMFDQPRGTGPSPADHPPPASSQADDAEMAIDPREYQPWILQRGSGRPSMMIGLRRYECRSGLWQGWGMSYPSLQAVDYLGDRLVSLEFPSRQFVIEGRGLDALVERLHAGSVTIVQEYNERTWPNRPAGPLIQTIRQISAQPPADG